MKIAVIIPARYDSTRFPGKPLIKLNGIPMIIRTCNSVSKVFSKKDIYVTTDDMRISNVCNSYGYNSIIVTDKCPTGTDRVSLAAQKLNYDYYINVQGDEPLISEEVIRKVKLNVEIYNSCITCVSKIYNYNDYISDQIVKMVFGVNNELIYASRLPIPFSTEVMFPISYKHVPIYGFNKDVLVKLYGNKIKTPLEKKEDIEIIRLLEYNIPVTVLEVDYNGISIDNPSDVQKAIEKL